MAVFHALIHGIKHRANHQRIARSAESGTLSPAMLKSLPAFDAALLLPPVSPADYRYFEHAAEHPFDATGTTPTLRNAWWLADCALAAYADPAMAQAIFQSGGLGLVEFAPVSGPRYGGQCYVAADESKIILAFRGTQVVKSEHVGDLERLRDTVKNVLRDIITDAKVRLVPWSGRAAGRVHQGFAGSLNELLPALSERVAALRSDNPRRKLWLTGHSLGGALATLAADRLEAVQGLHTFGSPQVGDATFAANFKQPGWRFRNHTDVVAWAPSGVTGYQHIAAGRYFDRHRKLCDEPGLAGLLKDGLQGAPLDLAKSLAALRQRQWSAIAPECLNDHAPIVYAILTWNAYLSTRTAGD